MDKHLDGEEGGGGFGIYLGTLRWFACFRRLKWIWVRDLSRVIEEGEERGEERGEGG